MMMEQDIQRITSKHLQFFNLNFPNHDEVSGASFSVTTSFLYDFSDEQLSSYSKRETTSSPISVSENNFSVEKDTTGYAIVIPDTNEYSLILGRRQNSTVNIDMI